MEADTLLYLITKYTQNLTCSNTISSIFLLFFCTHYNNYDITRIL